MGNATSPLETSNGNSVGPLELLYSTVEQLLDSVQGAVHVDVVADFIDSVRWTEPFILLLISMQVVLFALVYTTRRHNVVQFIILSVLTAISLAAEKLNRFGRTHWRSFASQNYFDYAGLFLLIFVCGPFIIAANFIVINMGLRLLKIYSRKSRREAIAQSVISSTSFSSTPSSQQQQHQSSAQKQKES